MLLGQVPALQGSGLVERGRLDLDQCQIMQRIGDERACRIGTRVPGDDLAAAQDHHFVDEALHQDILEAVTRRHRVVVAAVADERRRRHPAAALLAWLQCDRPKRAQRGGIGDETLADRRGMPPGVVALAGAAARRQHGIEIVIARSLGDRRHEVGAGVLDQPLDLALVVALAWTAEAIGEQLVANQLGERPGALAPAVTADPRHCDLEVVVEQRQRHPAKERERRHMAVEERLGGLARIGFYEARIGLRQSLPRRRPGSMQKKWIFCRTPPITATASPKSTWP